MPCAIGMHAGGSPKRGGWRVLSNFVGRRPHAEPEELEEEEGEAVDEGAKGEGGDRPGARGAIPLLLQGVAGRSTLFLQPAMLQPEYPQQALPPLACIQPAALSPQGRQGRSF